MKTSEYEQILVVALHSVRIWMFCHILEANVIHMYIISNYLTEQEIFLNAGFLITNQWIHISLLNRFLHIPFYSRKIRFSWEAYSIHIVLYILSFVGSR